MTDDDSAEADRFAARDPRLISTLLLDPISQSPRLRQSWNWLAGLCLIAAAVLWWTNHADGAFVAATLGVLAWFIDLRNRLHGTDTEDETEEHATKKDQADHD